MTNLQPGTLQSAASGHRDDAAELVDYVYNRARAISGLTGPDLEDQ